MGKALVLLFSLLTTLFIDYIYTSEANIYAKFPSEVEAGKEFNVEITIEKGNLSEFGRFTQILPEGFTAKSDYRYFNFEDNRIKVLWITLPAGNTFSFNYTILVPPTYTGDFQLTGQFAYVMDNEKKVVELVPQSIAAKPSGSAINSQQTMASSGTDQLPTKENITCYRQFFDDGNSTIVKIKLNKDQLNNMAKVVEKIPAGFIASEIETNNGIFSYTDNTVKFLWMNIPQDEDFVISYRLTPQSGQNLDRTKINGEFSYSINNLTYSVAIVNKNFEEVEQTNVVAAIQPEIIEQQPQSHAGNVNYKIQIAAGHRLVNIKSYFKKFKVKEKVTVIQHEGWHKYTIKNFSEYIDARNYRNKIWASTPIDDAFVAAYNNNQRITVQEALMISNQKWYK